MLIPSDKIAIVEDELDGIDRDDTGDLEDLLRLVLISEECRNSKVIIGKDQTPIKTQKFTYRFHANTECRQDHQDRVIGETLT